MGIISSIGFNTADYWNQLCAGGRHSVAAPWSAPGIPGGENGRIWYSPIPENFDAGQWINQPKILKNSARFTQFALAATQEALAHSGLTTLPPMRTAVILGTTMGGVPQLLEAQSTLEQQGPHHVPSRLMAEVIPNMATAQIAMLHGLHGPQLTVSTACASSIDAIGLAAEMIQSGRADVVIAGGAENLLDPVVGFSLANARALSHALTAERASCPFDKDRSGFVMGEGAAVLIVESLEHAQQRGADIWAYVRGYASLADGYHITSPEPSGRWEAEAMSQALENAQCPAADIDVILAHGTSTLVGDRAELRSINQVFGHRAVPVTSVKGHIGHTMGASGAMSAIAGIMAMKNHRVPLTLGTEEGDPEIQFDLVLHNSRDMPVHTVLVNAFGFGGQNACIVLTKP